jgi:small subunit ribosomal protein S2
MKEHIAVREACRLGIPVFAMVDTNSDPTEIDFVIPANDDATKSIELILGVISEAMNEGLQESKAAAKESEAAASDEGSSAENAPKRERRMKSFAKKERTKKSDDEAMNAAVISRVSKESVEE